MGVDLMAVYGTDFVTSRMLAPHLRKQQGFEVNTIEDISAGSQLIEIPLAHVATTTDISLSALQTIDGVMTIENQFALVKDQALATDNGIYFPDSSGWRRWEGLRGGMLVTVRNGTTNNETLWQCANDEITFGTTEIEFVQVGSGGTDELIKVTSADTTADYLNEKVTVLRGLTKGVGSPSGDESLEIGLPVAVTDGSTLWYNASVSGWRVNTVLRVVDNVTDAVTINGPSSTTLTTITNTSTGGNSKALEVVSKGNSATAYVCQIRNNNASASNDNRLLVLQHDTSTAVADFIQAYRSALQFRVKADGQILSKFLAGTGNRPVYSDASGNLVNYTNNLVLKQILSISDGAATYRLTDFNFLADANRQHVVKYCLEFESDIPQDVRIILNTADTGMTASGTVKVRKPGEYMRVLYNSDSSFFNLDTANSIDVSLGASATNTNYVELEFYVLPTSAAPITLTFSQTIADAINPITLKANSRMYMQR